MLSPKELLRDDIAKLSISYETIVRGQDESIASLSKVRRQLSRYRCGYLFSNINNLNVSN